MKILFSFVEEIGVEVKEINFSNLSCRFLWNFIEEFLQKRYNLFIYQHYFEQSRTRTAISKKVEALTDEHTIFFTRY